MKKEFFETLKQDFEWLRYKEEFSREQRAKLTNMYSLYLGKVICPGCGNLWEIKYELVDYFCQIIENVRNERIIIEDEIKKQPIEEPIEEPKIEIEAQIEQIVEPQPEPEKTVVEVAKENTDEYVTRKCANCGKPLSKFANESTTLCTKCKKSND